MCKSPLFAYQYLALVDAGQGELVEDPCRVQNRKLWFMKNCDRQKFDLLKEENKVDGLSYFEIPCGNCIECRLNKSREWATRIACEQLTSYNSIFLTLTYDDDHLPMGNHFLPTLVEDHLSKFMDDLRAYCKYHYNADNIRFYGAGEYGSVTARPHYHVCIFNLPSALLDQSVMYKASFQGDIYYNNPVIDKIWKKGYCVIGDLNWQSAAYVARYVVKKLKGPKASKYLEYGIRPEFSRMSRRPGIGTQYYNSMKDYIYKYDSIVLPKIGKVKPSAFFDKKYAFDDPEVMAYIKCDRALTAERAKAYKLSKTDLDYESYLKVEEMELEARLKKLVRPLV